VVRQATERIETLAKNCTKATEQCAEAADRAQHTYNEATKVVSKIDNSLAFWIIGTSIFSSFFVLGLFIVIQWAAR
jgi:hypothetical protein